MADWYVSSTKYSTYSAWVVSHTYSVGDFIVPTAPAAGAKWVFRCTTGGTTSGAEPSWTSTNNGTTSSGTATFTNVTGQSTYAWSAAAGDHQTLVGSVAARVAGGDSVWVSSDHTETISGGPWLGSTSASASYSLTKYVSVNKAGSTPPVAADMTAGANIGDSAQPSWTIPYPCYVWGIQFQLTGTNGTTGSAGSNKKHVWYENCTFYMSGGTINLWQWLGSTAFAIPNVTFSNCTFNFSNASQGFGGLGFQQYNFYNATFTGTAINNVFQPSSTGTIHMVMRGTDISSITGTLVTNNASGWGSKYLFESCKIASGVTRYSTTSVATCSDLVELVNCYDGTHYISESYQPAGTLTTEFTTYLSGGAQDNVGNYSHKVVTTANCDRWVNSFNCFWLDVNLNQFLGSSCTATVEISSGGSLNNDDVYMVLEYEGTASSSLSSFVSSQPATILTSNAAITSSGASWNSGAGTNQKLTCTFTPRVAGRLRAQVRVGKPSATVYINPQISVSSP